MLVALILWIVLAVAVSVLVGRGIHQADLIEFPRRAEHGPWTATPSRAAPDDAREPAALAGRAGARPAPGVGRTVQAGAQLVHQDSAVLTLDRDGWGEW